MTFVIQGKSTKPGEGHFWTEEATAKEAIKRAVELLGNGMVEVAILDNNDGRIYEPTQFAELFRKNPPP
jgi:hypothetical protein